MKPVEVQPSLTEQAYQAILDEICDGNLPAGMHLVQEQLASELGVSRQPIQQAMALLRNDGLVEEAGGRGLYVAPLDLARMAQHYEIRGALDCLAARLAANRAGASPEVAVAVRRAGLEIIEAGNAAVAAGVVKDMVTHDVAFHKFIYERSGNPLLSSAAEPHWRFLRRVMGDILRQSKPPRRIWDEHEEILEAIVDGNADLAEERAAIHIEAASRSLVDVLGEKGT